MRKLQFKFPSQIRISGWDFGSSARAMNQAGGKDSLMTYESVSKTQADLRKGRRSTTERKSMSTKTTIKRIALVAVAALGLGGISAVSATAAIDATPTAISIATPAGFVPGSMTYVPVTLTLPAGVTLGTDTVTVVARVTSAPATSNAISSAAAGTQAARTSTTPDATVMTWAVNTAPGSGAYGAWTDDKFSTGANTGSTANWTVADTYTPATGDLKGQITLRLGFAPDAAGSYTILVAASGTQNATTMMGYSTATLAGLISTSAVITTNGGPTAVALTPVNATAATTVTSTGSLVKVTLSNATGASLLGAGESVTLTANSTTVSFSDSVLTNGDFTNGVAYVNVYDTAEETVTISAAQSGTLTGLSAGSTAIKYVAGTSTSTAVIGVTPSQTTYVADTASGSDDVAYTASTTRTTQTVCVTDTAATATDALYSYVKFTDDSGKLTGKTGATFAVPVTIAAGADAANYGCVTVSGTLLNAQYFTVAALTSNATNQMRITGATRAASTMTVTPTASLLAAAKSSNTFTFKVKDQFGSALAGETVTFTLVGRNAAASTSAISDASGYVTYTVTDAGTTGTVDTLTATDGSATKAVTITYGTETAPTTMTLTGGNTSAGVTSAVKTAKDINAGIDGASATTHTITATLKNSVGSYMAGVPVTWTISGTGAAITSTTKTTYSAADGTASASVYGWVAGTYTVTATAGTKTATAEITFGQTGAGEQRAISVSVAGGVATAKVVDRFGNPVPSVTVYATQAGGLTINGKTKDSVATDSNGLADFIVSGAGTVTVSTISYSDPAGSKGSGQSSARKGAVTYNQDAADDEAFTATTVGTTTTAETGVGASFDAAGVDSASADVANSTSADSVDAANEATDAANAATDAANAAAEAADAATAAAQDAQAAVAALATSVASLIAGIKAQITTLTNLVIKIQKKVRA